MCYPKIGLTNFQCTIAFTMMVRLSSKRLLAITILLWVVLTLSVPPPHTVSSVKNFMIMSEGISGRNAQILEDEGSELAMNDSDAFALLSNTFPAPGVNRGVPEIGSGFKGNRHSINSPFYTSVMRIYLHLCT